MANSLYWYDYETFGLDPSRDGISQFAGIRTNERLEVIGEPLTIYCYPPIDRLPSPEACLVTGITPQIALETGIPEKEFIQKKDGSVIADGNSKIRDLNNYVGWDLDEDGSKTINGAIIDHLDQIPQENVCLELGLYRIEVLQIEENFITKVKINKKGS